MGVTYTYPLYRRADEAVLRRAELEVSRQRSIYRELEETILLELQSAHQDIINRQQAMRLAIRRREASKLRLESTAAFYKVGEISLDLYLRAQRTYAEAIRDEKSAVTNLKLAQAYWKFTQGIINLVDEDDMELESESSFPAEPEKLKIEPQKQAPPELREALPNDQK
ncbi:MAG: hypothetical protein CMJ78_00585 [Planctomycetaceae bacterium]|nr:hypothetical protein [Planctomycetaceae bacterium]